MIEKRWLPLLRDKFSDIDKTTFDKISEDLFAYSTFIFKAESFRLDEFPIHHKVYSELLRDAKRVLVEVGTLSIGFDNLLLRYKATKSTTFIFYLNAMANYLLEMLMDYNRPPYRATYRFGIGYQGTPIEDLQPLIYLMNMDREISFTETGFMKPIKTIVGIRGILL